MKEQELIFVRFNLEGMKAGYRMNFQEKNELGNSLGYSELLTVINQDAVLGSINKTRFHLTYLFE